MRARLPKFISRGKIDLPLLWRESARILTRRVFVRGALWQILRRDARHPVGSHLSLQLKQGRRPKVLLVSMAWATLLLISFAFAYSRFDHGIIWTLPLWLMLFSAVYCVIWIARIVALMGRQARYGVLDEVSVIPPGRVFVYLTVCKVVMNEDDALAWLTLLRRMMAGILFFSLFIAICLVITQLGQIKPLEIAVLLIELALLALVIPIEHTQSAIIACLTAILMRTRARGQIDRTSITAACFALLQILAYSLAIAAGVASGISSLSVTIALFIFIREMLILALWRVLLRDANEDDLPQVYVHWHGELRRES